MENYIFKRSDVCQIIGLSQRQLQYWDATNLLGPSHRTPGGHGRYTFQDLIAYKTAKRLLDAGASLQKIRRSIRELRRLLPTVKSPLAELTLVATGDVILVFYENTVFEAISGQEWIISIAEIKQEVERWHNRMEGIRKHRGPVRAQRSGDAIGSTSKQA